MLKLEEELIARDQLLNDPFYDQGEDARPPVVYSARDSHLNAQAREPFTLARSQKRLISPKLPIGYTVGTLPKATFFTGIKVEDGGIPPRFIPDELNRTPWEPPNRWFHFGCLKHPGGIRVFFALLDIILGTDDLGKATIRAILSNFEEFALSNFYVSTYLKDPYGSGDDPESTLFDEAPGTLQLLTNLPNMPYRSKDLIDRIDLPVSSNVPKNSRKLRNRIQAVLKILFLYNQVEQGFPKNIENLQLKVGKTKMQTLNRAFLDANRLWFFDSNGFWNYMSNSIIRYMDPDTNRITIRSAAHKKADWDRLSYGVRMKYNAHGVGEIMAGAPNYKMLVDLTGLIRCMMITTRYKAQLFLLATIINRIVCGLRYTRDRGKLATEVLMVRDFKILVDTVFGDSGRHALCKNLLSSIKTKALASTAEGNPDLHGYDLLLKEDSMAFQLNEALLLRQLGMEQPGVTYGLANTPDYYNTDIFMQLSTGRYPEGDCDAATKGINELYDYYLTLYGDQGANELIAGQEFKFGGVIL